MTVLSTAVFLSVCACAEATANSGGATASSVDPLERTAPEDLFRQGEQLARQGDPIRAEQYVSSAVQRGFPAQRALPLLLRVCIASSRLGAALQYASPYLKLHPEDYHLRYLVAAVQLGLGRYAQAQDELTRVLRDDPDYADAHYLLGVILRDQRGDAAAAAEQFAEHQRLNARGLHGAEVAAWLREHERSADASTQPAETKQAPLRMDEPATDSSASTASQPVADPHARELGPSASEGKP
jgi:tetratricopeptide (TPR) repeat protein